MLGCQVPTLSCMPCHAWYMCMYFLSCMYFISPTYIFDCYSCSLTPCLLQLLLCFYSTFYMYILQLFNYAYTFYILLLILNPNFCTVLSRVKLNSFQHSAFSIQPQIGYCCFIYCLPSNSNFLLHCFYFLLSTFYCKTVNY